METVFGELLFWIVALPLLGAVCNGLAGRWLSKPFVTAVGVGSVGLAFLIAVIDFGFLTSLTGGSDHAAIHFDLYQWFSVTVGRTEVPVQVAFRMDALSGVMTLVVTGIGFLIHVYSVGYMHDDPGYARFFAYLNLFMASMLVLVLASNLPVMFIGWEGVGLCSYLLIGFWWQNPAYAAAGRKAFVANRIGDFGVLIGMFIILQGAHTWEFAEINQRVAQLGAPWQIGPLEMMGSLVAERGAPLGMSMATAACLFLFLGCTGKSAQVPLYVWLPDAMAGPTPVSALIHAATMVTAGVYLCCRLSPLFLSSPTIMMVIAIVGAFTALLAASIALVQNEIKKVLAYSTVSQLGFMFAAVGSAAFAAGIFHVFTHAFFKACLFLGAGSVMHAVGAHGDADIRKLGGLHKVLPKTHWTFLVSCLAIAGFPLFSGFFSKDEILLGSLQAAPLFGAPLAHLVFVMLVLAAVMTAFYMFRLYFLTFRGEYRSAAAGDAPSSSDAAHAHAYDAHPHESPSTMTLPLAILGVGAIGVGFLGLPHAFGLPNLWGEWLHPVLAALPVHGEGHHTVPTEVWVAMASGISATLIGIGLAYWMYQSAKGRPAGRLSAALPGLHRVLMDKWRVDELYDVTILRTSRGLARGSARFDDWVVDGLLTKASSASLRGVGWMFTRLQNGVVYAYGAALVAGLLILGWWYVYPHPALEAQADGERVVFQAAKGLGYQYCWELGAGTACTSKQATWSRKNNRLFKEVEPADYHGLALLLERRLGSEDKLELVDDEPRVLPAWVLAEQGDKALPPAVQRRGAALTLRPNAASVRVNGEVPLGSEVLLRVGDRGFIGRVAFELAAIVRARVHVRNAFGHRASEAEDVLVRPSTAPASQGVHARLQGAP